MNPIRPALLVALALAAGSPRPAAAQAPALEARGFEISTSNLFEALRELAAARDLDLLVDPGVPDREAFFAFKHTDWQGILDALAASEGLACEIQGRILHVGLAARVTGDGPKAASPSARTITLTYRPEADGSATLSVRATRATRREIKAALVKVERIAKARPDRRPFSASWELRPEKASARDAFETFSFEDITPAGLRALYP